MPNGHGWHCVVPDDLAMRFIEQMVLRLSRYWRTPSKVDNRGTASRDLRRPTDIDALDARNPPDGTLAPSLDIGFQRTGRRRQDDGKPDRTVLHLDISHHVQRDEITSQLRFLHLSQSLNDRFTGDHISTSSLYSAERTNRARRYRQ